MLIASTAAVLLLLLLLLASGILRIQIQDVASLKAIRKTKRPILELAGKSPYLCDG